MILSPQTVLIVLVYAALADLATLYARFLDRPRVHRWYSPDRVWWTVVGGDVLIGLAIGALWLLNVLPWLAVVHYTGLHIAAGGPIIYWQNKRAAKRHKQLEEIDRRP